MKHFLTYRKSFSYCTLERYHQGSCSGKRPKSDYIWVFARRQYKLNPRLRKLNLKLCLRGIVDPND